MSPTPTGVPRLRDLLAADRRGERAGVTSICSAEPFVLEAAANQVKPGEPGRRPWTDITSLKKETSTWIEE